MEIEKTRFEGLLRVQNPVYTDQRGIFFENFNQDAFKKAGLPYHFAQDNFSRSAKGVVRGLHLQLAPHAQLKYVRTIVGSILDVAVDLRADSPTFGEVYSEILSADKYNALVIPEGFGHGLAALEDSVFHYKCTDIYHPESETGVRWDDPDLGIDWMVKTALVSEKDKKLPTFKEFKEKYIT